MIENINEKMRALGVALDCIHGVRNINPDSVDIDDIRLLSELRVDLTELREHRDQLANKPDWALDIRDLLE